MAETIMKYATQLLALTVLKAVKETSNMPIANYQFVKVQNVI